MEKRRENMILFVLLGVLIVASIFFNPGAEKTGQYAKAVGLCNPDWYCIDSTTMAYRDNECITSKVTSCGVNERCVDNYCRHI